MSITEKPSDFEANAPALECRVLSTIVDIDIVEHEWRSLAARCPDVMAYYQSYDWCRNWIAVVAPEAGVLEARIVTVWLGGELVALLPLMLSRGPGGIRILSNLGEPHSQYAGMLTDPVLYCEQAGALIKDYLSAPPECDLVNLDLLPETSPLCDLTGADWNRNERINESSALDLKQFENSDAYLGAFDAKKLRKRNKRRNRIANNLGPLQLREIWAGEDGFEQAVRDVIALKKIWLAETGRISTGFALPSYADFLLKLDGDRETREGLVAFVLMAGDRQVAVEVSMIRKGHMYAYIGGFDWELRNISPGKVQMEATVCWAIDNGISSYDLLGNVAAYKESWSNITCPLHSCSRAFTLLGKFYAHVWLGRVRPGLKQAYSGLPAGVRKVIGQAQAPSK